MRHRTPACLLLLSLAVIAIAGCERSRESVVEAPQRESLVVLRRVNGGDPQTLDPARAEDEHAFNVLTDLYEGLLVLDAKGNLIPGVAEDWELSSDGHSYTFHLNTNARWSNGERVTAEHFLTSFSRTLTPTTRSPYSFLLHPIRNAAKVALAVSAMWRDVLGVEVALDKREWKYFLDTRDRREEWQIMRFAWTGDYDHPSTFTGILHSESPQNLAGYKNPRSDELIDAATITVEPDAQSLHASDKITSFQIK